MRVPKHDERSMMRMSILALLLIYLCSASADTGPENLVRTTTTKIITLLNENLAVYARDRDQLYGMVHQYVLPHFDFRAMSKLVLGKDIWTQANEEQRVRFTHEFRDMLVRTYATALLKYKGEDIIYRPSRVIKGGRRVVSTEIKQPTGPKVVHIDYWFYQNNSDWRVYNVTIDGVSIVTTYRNIYMEQVSRYGLDTLIESVVELNEQARH